MGVKLTGNPPKFVCKLTGAVVPTGVSLTKLCMPVTSGVYFILSIRLAIPLLIVVGTLSKLKDCVCVWLSSDPSSKVLCIVS